MAERGTIKQVMIILSAAYPRFEITADTGRVYADLLGDLPDDLLIAATKQHATTSKWFPSVAELREAAMNIKALADGTRTAEEAWINIQAAISRFGWYGESLDPEEGGGWRVPSMLAPLELRTINALGGWKMLCQSQNAPADRAHFLKIYKGLLERETMKATMLPEIREFVQELEARMDAPQLERGK